MQYNDLIPELLVSDSETSRDFYVGLLGFRVVYERPEDRFLFLELGGAQLMIEQVSQEDLTSLTYPFGNGANYSLAVPDVEGLYAHLQAKNYPIHRPLEVREFRVDDGMVLSKEFSVLDPDGYVWRLSD